MEVVLVRELEIVIVAVVKKGRLYNPIVGSILRNEFVSPVYGVRGSTQFSVHCTLLLVDIFSVNMGKM